MNELEQLKRDNEVLYRDNVAMSEVADALRASNARLRDALERIANNHWTSSAAESMRCIARAALGESE